MLPRQHGLQKKYGKMRIVLTSIILLVCFNMYSQNVENYITKKLYGEEKIYLHESDLIGNRVFTIQDSLLSVNYKEIVGGKKFLSVNYENISSTSYVPPFNFWAVDFKNINLPYSSKSNNVVRFGFNTSGGGGKIDQNEHDLHIAFENSYYPQVAIAGLPVGHEIYEWHLQSTDKNNVVHRPITIAGSTTGLGSGIGLEVDEIYLKGYNDQEQWLRFNRNFKHMQMMDTATIRFEKIQDDIALLNYFTGVRFWDIISTSGDKLVINRQNNPLEINAQKMRMEFIPIVTGATSGDANANAISVGVGVGEAYKWDDGSAILMMIRK